MSTCSGLSVDGLWQPRTEPVDSLAARLRRYFALLRLHLPSDLSWWAYCDEDGTSSFDVEADTERAREAILAGRDNDDEEDDPYMGYSLILFLSTEDPCMKPARGAQLRLQIGASNFQNSFTFDSDVYFEDKADPRLTTYNMMRANLMAAAFAFRPDWCTVAPYRLADYLDSEVYNRPFISLAWMTWLGGDLVKKIALPPSCRNLIMEGYTDNSLFMATGKSFSCDNPEDLRQARAIHREIDHLNYTVPFRGKCGRNPNVPPCPICRDVDVDRPIE